MVFQTNDHNPLRIDSIDLIRPECKLVCTILAYSDILVCESRDPLPSRVLVPTRDLSPTLIRNSACIHFCLLPLTKKVWLVRSARLLNTSRYPRELDDNLQTAKRWVRGQRPGSGRLTNMFSMCVF
jgi:hypothetical protein